NRNAMDPTSTVQAQNAYTARVDHNIGQNNFFWFRISGSLQYKNASGGRPALPQSQEFRARNIGMSYVHTFGASSVLQAQFGTSKFVTPLDRNFTTVDTSFFKQQGFADSMTSNFIENKRIDPSMNVTDWFANGGYYTYNRPSDDKQYKVNFSKVHGSHIIKAGWDLASTDNQLNIALAQATFTTLQTAAPQSTGTTGSALASYLLGLPDTAGRRNTIETMRWGGVMGMYIQDQWKATPKLTINYGLRYDRNFIPPFGREEDNNMYTGSIDFNRGVYVLLKAPPSCAVAKTAPCLPSGSLPDHVELSPTGKITKDPTKQFQPRLGLAYRVRPATVIRASAGIVFDNWSGVQQASRNYAGMWPSIGFVSVSNLNPANAVASTKATDPLPSGVIPAATPFLVTGYYLAPDWKNAYSVQYNFGLQHQVGSSTVLSATYVGSGTHRLDVGGLYNVATTPGPGTASLRYPYPYIVPQNYTRPWGNASYQSLQLMADGRFTRGLTYRFSYTWAKSIDTGSSGFFGAEDYSVQNPYNIGEDRSVSGFDLTHVFSASWVYQLPFGTGKALQTGNKAADYIIGNWQFNGITLLRSGAPFNLTVTGDLANTGNTNYLRPNVVGDWHLSNRSPAAWFKTSAFDTPPYYTFGNAGRNVMRADWMRNFDLSVFRQFPLKGDRSKLELRAEAFNTFNTPCYSAPTANRSSGDFGKIFSTANAARQLQLSLKLIF
ncbi:MAG: TonB-dependent receptor, partial [Acidobacteriales bacterium]|nr:TonB-dependent receptor [Terriglobales bacterium]